MHLTSLSAEELLRHAELAATTPLEIALTTKLRAVREQISAVVVDARLKERMGAAD